MFCLGLLGPEFILLNALEQFCSARASVRAFSTSDHSGWTMKHAFFADMGGIHLQLPNAQLDEPKSFPINAKQLHFLVTNRYIPFPGNITLDTIRDKNKSDGLARFICFIQMFWFTLSTVSRPIKGYATTTLEITTLAYIVCALATMFFWRHKPMDVQDAIFLDCHRTLDQLLGEHGRSAAGPYHFTPLDFVSREEWIASRLWVYNVNLLRRMRIIHTYQKELPIQHFSSFNFLILKRSMLFVSLAISLAYTSVFVAGWNLHFPTTLERILWRTCSLGTMMIVAIGGLFEILFLVQQYSRTTQGEDIEMGHGPPLVRSHPLIKPPPTRMQAAIRHAKNKTPDIDPEYDVPIRSLVVTLPLCALYSIFRLCILLEDFISFRRLPATAFMAIDWSTYLPHI
ncbi:uncharacterized protein BDR25DRAFT_252761 [Lindgomyces ingoldianus]|uniref:Uncharacterized protein n=1 Tax=Lindgomyces ingoldianus TaxID=673940 RepID=A0ACB6RBU6_9PLEO|nr:uncharacterized protein BDR25DRAFT_252761 [Lindgomyces ingoldianus]KAF2476621.1 hypothetical protein BDR25DRAFT_252761 [Lindgomyces ingoldianus]